MWIALGQMPADIRDDEGAAVLATEVSAAKARRQHGQGLDRRVLRRATRNILRATPGPGLVRRAGVGQGASVHAVAVRLARCAAELDKLLPTPLLEIMYHSAVGAQPRCTIVR